MAGVEEDGDLGIGIDVVNAMKSSFTRLGLGIVFAVLLVYLLMAVNFQSWLDPFIILTALPGAMRPPFVSLSSLAKLRLKAKRSILVRSSGSIPPFGTFEHQRVLKSLWILQSPPRLCLVARLTYYAIRYPRRGGA